MSLICNIGNSIRILFVFTMLINGKIYGQLIYPDAVPLGDEQITVNGQTYTAKEWVKCYGGDHLKLKLDLPYDSDHCYDWLTITIGNYQTEGNAILKQILSAFTMNKLGENDWSYDQFNLFQGKHWK